MFSAKVRNGLSSFVALVREGRRMDGELKDVVEMIVDKTGLLQAFRAEGTMESESRAENIQEFLGVAAEFEETHEDIEGTLESLGRAARSRCCRRACRRRVRARRGECARARAGAVCTGILV